MRRPSPAALESIQRVRHYRRTPRSANRVMVETVARKS